MLRGMTTFVCDNCGHKFKGMDIEWNATVFSQPLRCPNCGSYHTCPKSFLGLNKSVYRDIWKRMDEAHKAPNAHLSISNSMNVFFQPYVGKDYTTGGLFGKRIMVLGESHYCDEGCADCGNVSSHRECMAFTNGVVGDYLNEDKPRERWMSTFLKFERSLVGHETDWPERHRIWQSVLFYNYLQVAMGGPRKAGTDAEYRQAEQAFFSVLDQYRPQYIIAWGNRLWGQMPGGERWQDGDELTIDGYTVYTGSYALSGGGRVKVMAVNHPSVGYSWDYWHKVIEAFLK